MSKVRIIILTVLGVVWVGVLAYVLGIVCICILAYVLGAGTGDIINDEIIDSTYLAWDNIPISCTTSELVDLCGEPTSYRADGKREYITYEATKFEFYDNALTAIIFETEGLYDFTNVGEVAGLSEWNLSEQWLADNNRNGSVGYTNDAYNDVLLYDFEHGKRYTITFPSDSEVWSWGSLSCASSMDAFNSEVGIPTRVEYHFGTLDYIELRYDFSGGYAKFTFKSVTTPELYKITMVLN